MSTKHTEQSNLLCVFFRVWPGNDIFFDFRISRISLFIFSPPSPRKLSPPPSFTPHPLCLILRTTMGLPEIQITTVATGHGNLATADLLEYDFVDAGFNVFSTPISVAAFPAKIWHRRMTRRARSYNDNLRGSLASQLLGVAMASEAGLRRGLRRADVLLAVQELPLTLFSYLPSLIPVFFRQLYLFIPDVDPKANAVDLMHKLSPHLTPVVWNQSAQQKLETQSLSPILARSPFALITEEEIALHQQRQPPYAVLKQSGSGLNRVLRETALGSLAPNTPLLEITPDQTIIHDQGSSRSYPNPGFLPMYRTIGLAQHVISHPSEVVGVLAENIARGWQGEVTFFAPRGRHEQANLDFFARLGYPYSIISTDGKITTFTPETVSYSASRAFAHSQLGTIPLSQILANSLY